jgi:hypothetical protein
MGDRIGLATPRHVRAIRAAQGKIAPIFAQQSIREMARTRRTPQQVLDAATWGVFSEGWQDGMGADATSLGKLQERVKNLPAELQPYVSGLLGKTYNIEGLQLE